MEKTNSMRPLFIVEMNTFHCMFKSDCAITIAEYYLLYCRILSLVISITSMSFVIEHGNYCYSVVGKWPKHITACICDRN